MTKLSMVMIGLEPNWSWSKQKQAQETLLRLDGFGWNSVRNKDIQTKPIRMIFVWKEGYMTHSQCRAYHYEYEHKEISFEELLNLTTL